MSKDEWFFRVKTATRALVKMLGSYEAAGLVACAAKSQMHRWADPTYPDLITLSAVMKLEAECGMPCITEVLAAQHGQHLVRSDGTAQPSCMATAFAGVADEFGEVASRVANALEDGEISGAEQTAISDALARLSQAVSRAHGAHGRLRAVNEQRRAS